MAEKTVKTRIQVKSDTDDAFGKATFTPKDGEPVFYETSKRFKVGDGATKIGDLPFVTLPLDDDNIVDVGELGGTLYFSGGDINIGGTVDANSVSTALVDASEVQVRADSSKLTITPTTISSDSKVDIASGSNYVEVANDGVYINGDTNAGDSNFTTTGNISATDITASSYITATKTITAEGFITRGGTSSQFVKGDGSLGTIPASLKNPNALNIKTISGTVTYDGSSAQVVDSVLSAMNDSSGNKIVDTYVTNSTFDSYHSVSDKSISAKIYRNMLKGYLPITIDSDDAQTFEGDSFINGRLLQELIDDGQITFADSVTNANALFIGSSLDGLPAGLNINNVTSVRAMFALCFNLYGVGAMIHNKTITDYNSVFCYCHNLIGCGDWDMGGATDMTEAFYDCNHLLETPIGDMSSCADFTRTFDKCYDLESINFTNISASIDVSDCYKLDREALVSLIGNLATVTTSPTLKLGTTLYNKLTAAEIAVATGKGWTVE